MVDGASTYDVATEIKEETIPKFNLLQIQLLLNGLVVQLQLATKHHAAAHSLLYPFPWWDGEENQNQIELMV